MVASDVGGAQLSFGHVYFTTRREAEAALSAASEGRLVMGRAARPVRVANPSTQKLPHAETF